MGFGLIFTGYITFLFLKVLPPAMLVGAYLMYRGLSRLSVYGKHFRTARRLAAGFMAYFALYSAFWLGKLLGVLDVMSHAVFDGADSVVYLALQIAFHVFLYAALEQIARDCGYEKGVKKVYFARVLLAMFVVFDLVALPLAYFHAASYIRFAALVCQLVWYIHTAVLLYGFYMRVATQEIIDDEEKKLAEYDRKHTIPIPRRRK